MGWLIVILCFSGFVWFVLNEQKKEQQKKEKNKLRRDAATSLSFETFHETSDFDTTFIIAGTGHRGSDVKESIAAMASVPARNLARCTVKLKREPSNQYDEFAVKVYIENIFFGYVPAFMSEEVSDNINGGHRYTCQVIEITDRGGVVVGLK